MMARMEKNKEIFGLPLMFWGLWVTLLILWMGRFVTSFLSMYLVSDMHVSAVSYTHLTLPTNREV